MQNGKMRRPFTFCNTPEMQPAVNISSEINNSPLRAVAGKSQLWSSLVDVCKVLRVPFSTSEEVRFQHLQYRPGKRLHTSGQPFDTLYLVNSGFLKTVTIDEMGEEQVIGFQMKGDLIGVDGIHSKSYRSEAIALTPCDVIAIPFKTLVAIGRNVPEFEMAMLGVMSRELIREQHLLVTLGSLGADARVGRFLASMSERFLDLGYSGMRFTLCMTRQEIGSYLGLTVESVSRALTGFQAAGYITVNQREISVHDLKALKIMRKLPSRRKTAVRE